METTLGGDRLGSGNKQKISMRNYERSTHDLSYIWRSTMASGTLVPFLNEIGLPGDTFDIDLNCNVMTHPTIGPLFGSYKVQLDIFQTPIRLYNGKLHMNKLGIGMDMEKIKIPQITLTADGGKYEKLEDNDQINPSCILSYLNIRGLGLNKTENQGKHDVVRSFNGVSLLAYWDIYKNYYANKQEEIGYVVHNPMEMVTNNVYSMEWHDNKQAVEIKEGVATNITLTATGRLYVNFENQHEPAIGSFYIVIDGELIRPDEVFSKITWRRTQWNMSMPREKFQKTMVISGWSYGGETKVSVENPPQLKEFDLENIDKMRESILKDVGNNTAFEVLNQELEPYKLLKHEGTSDPNNKTKAYSKLASQEGLGIKTYNSDLFNNWISTEWIDGDNGINEITSIDTSSGSFNIDTLNLANKVYNMLNRIAISGGTYDDWLDAVYTHERAKSVESPVYMGSLIKELVFEEVVSTTESANGDQPLGTLAGRGVMHNKHKGGKIRVKIDEPSYITGIVSITPRIDYSQGNKWDVNLKTMNDLHKPAMDEIGFQDLITDQMAWKDSNYNPLTGTMEFKSAGKQPAWINYMTNVNQVRGNFAEENQMMWMTLNRKYGGTTGINDLTTYVDPVKFNHIFADTSLDAQNFWVQISNNVTARRKMSAKIIPNL